MEKVYSHPRASLIERLAVIEGTSPFLSLLEGCEQAPDSTDDMAALAFTHAAGCIPEVLEAHVAKSDMFKRPLMSMTFDAIAAELSPRAGSERQWRKWRRDRKAIQGAIADAFFILRDGSCKPLADRAKWFRIDLHVYSALRNVAAAVLFRLCNEAEQAWIRARFSRVGSSDANKNNKLAISTSETPVNRYSGGESEAQKARFGRDVGCYIARPLTSDDDAESAFDARGLGIARTSGLGWCEQHADPSPCITTYMPGYEPATNTPVQPPTTRNKKPHSRVGAHVTP